MTGAIEAAPAGGAQPVGRYELYCRDVASSFLLPSLDCASEALQREVLVQHLYEYLSFTVHLERGPVVKACSLIAREQVPIGFSLEMRKEAELIMDEEYEHGESYEVLWRWVRGETGVVPVPAIGAPAFLRRLDRITQSEPDLASWLTLFFTIISETLVTKQLSTLFGHEGLHPKLREGFRRHAVDEARHYKFFSRVLHHCWPRVPNELRGRIASRLPELMRAYLLPDRDCIAEILATHAADVGVSPKALANAVVCHPELRERLVEATRPTQRLLVRRGVVAAGDADPFYWWPSDMSALLEASCGAIT